MSPNTTSASAVLLGPLVAAICAGALAAQTPAALVLSDVTLGTPASGLVLGHAVTFDVVGEPGEVVLVLASPTPPPVPPPLVGGVPLAVDPASFAILFDGFARGLAIGPGGVLHLPARVPPTLVLSKFRRVSALEPDGGRANPPGVRLRLLSRF